MNPVATPEETLKALFAYCRVRDWAGHDPYDALNSPILDSVARGGMRIPKLLMTQLLKRSPVNLRGLLRIRPTQNPKALALMLRATLKLENRGIVDTSGVAAHLISRIAALRSTETSYWCWGYSFPWQTRTALIPRGSPNLVCTVFVASALMDAWESTRNLQLLQMAESAAHYIARELYIEGSSELRSFAYPRVGMESSIHNANLLAAALLIRVHAQRPDDVMLARALATARYSASRQRADGSWPYGESTNQRWIDNFHTGYNLCALCSISRALRTHEFDEHIQAGFGFYRLHFIRKDGAPRYFHDKTYPVDIHCAAQTILTLLEFADVDTSTPKLAQTVYEWSMRHMWDPSGYFYYRLLRLVTIRTSYMRWSQAWMLLALAVLAEKTSSTPTAYPLTRQTR